MAVQGRDVIFKFENSCNFKCCPWLACCSNNQIEEEDAVFVDKDGSVKKFDFKKAQVGCVQTLDNIERLLINLAQDHYKMKAITVAVQRELNISLDEKSPKILKASELRRIETIANPILRSRSDELRRKQEKLEAQPSFLVKSPKMRDLRLDEIEDEKSQDAVWDMVE